MMARAPDPGRKSVNAGTASLTGATGTGSAGAVVSASKLVSDRGPWAAVSIEASCRAGNRCGRVAERADDALEAAVGAGVPGDVDRLRHVDVGVHSRSQVGGAISQRRDLSAGMQAGDRGGIERGDGGCGEQVGGSCGRGVVECPARVVGFLGHLDACGGRKRTGSNGACLQGAVDHERAVGLRTGRRPCRC